MMPTTHILQDDLALYAMQLLSPDEMTAFGQHLKGCAECRGELAAVRGDLLTYALSVDEATPPLHARERLLTAIGAAGTTLAGATAGGAVLPFARPAHTENSRAAAPASGLLRTAVPWLGWAVAAGLTVAVVNLHRQREDLSLAVANQQGLVASLTAEASRAHLLLEAINSPSATRVTLTRPKSAPAPIGRATYLADKGTLLFLASNMAPLNEAKVYELWLIPTNGGKPIPAGTFSPDLRGNASVVMPKLPPGVEAKAFGITVEAVGGSLSPTSPIIMVGAVAS